MCLIPIRNKLYYVLYLCTEHPSDEWQYFWGLKTPGISGAKYSIQKGTSAEVFITRFPLVVNLSWIVFEHFLTFACKAQCIVTVLLCFVWHFHSVPLFRIKAHTIVLCYPLITHSGISYTFFDIPLIHSGFLTLMSA